MAVVEELQVLITASDKASSTFSKFSSGLGALGTAGKVALGAVAGGIAAVGAGVALIASKAIPAASNLNEAMNAVNVVFGDSSQEIIDWGSKAASQAGLAQSAFFQMSAQTGAMLQNLGLDQASAAEESINLAKRAADMASIFNTDVNDALAAIQAGLRGEADPLERFGVRLSQTAVHAKAVEMGLIGVKDQMDDQTRATAALALLYEQTDSLAGDFVNTSGDLANAQRVAKAQFENFLATIGSIGLPILGKFFKIVSTSIMPTLDNFAKYIKRVVETGDTMNGFLNMLPKRLRPIVEIIGNVIVAFQNLFQGLASGEDPLGDIANLFYDLGLAFGLTKDQAGDLFFAVVAVGQGIQNFIAQAQPIIANIIQVVSQFVSWKDVLIALGIAVAAVIIPAIASLIAAVAPIILVFAGLVGLIALVRNAWEKDWGGIQGKTRAAINFIQNVIRGFMSAVESFWAAHGEQILTAAKNLWDGVKAAFTVFKTAFMSIYKAFRAALEGDWRAVGENLRKAWDTLWNSIKGRLQTAINSIRQKITSTNWGSLGRSIIQGIANGISSALSIIKNAAIRAARAALDAAKGFLGIDSPSKVFKVVGGQMISGMGEGIREQVSDPVRAINAVTGATVDAAGGTLGGAGGFFINSINIVASPGMDEEDLANRVISKLLRASRGSAANMFAG